MSLSREQKTEILENANGDFDRLCATPNFADLLDDCPLTHSQLFTINAALDSILDIIETMPTAIALVHLKHIRDTTFTKNRIQSALNKITAEEDNPEKTFKNSLFRLWSLLNEKLFRQKLIGRMSTNYSNAADDLFQHLTSLAISNCYSSIRARHPEAERNALIQAREALEASRPESAQENSDEFQSSLNSFFTQIFSVIEAALRFQQHPQQQAQTMYTQSFQQVAPTLDLINNELTQSTTHPSIKRLTQTSLAFMGTQSKIHSITMKLTHIPTATRIADFMQGDMTLSVFSSLNQLKFAFDQLNFFNNQTAKATIETMVPQLTDNEKLRLLAVRLIYKNTLTQWITALEDVTQKIVNLEVNEREALHSL